MELKTIVLSLFMSCKTGRLFRILNLEEWACSYRCINHILVEHGHCNRIGIINGSITPFCHARVQDFLEV